MNKTKVTFSYIDSEIVEENGELTNKQTEKEFTCYVDPSINAQTRFEANFPLIAEKGIDLIEYTRNIHDKFKAKGDKPLSLAEIGVLLKVMYCWFDTDVSFSDFVTLFTLGDEIQQRKTTEKFIKIIEMIFGSSAEKN